MYPSEGGGDFVVEEPEPDIYNSTGLQPPAWQPVPQDILNMFQQLEADQVLPLKWVCPGRRPPETEAPVQPSQFMSDEEHDGEDKDDEKRVPEATAFDFDDTASEASSKVKMIPRTPVSAKAKRPEKKVARMDNVLNSIKRQQKAERAARKNQARTLGASPFRAGTPSHMAGFSPAASPRMPTSTISPGPSSPRGSPRMGAPIDSPSSRLVAAGEAMDSKPVLPEFPSLAAGRPTGSPSSARGLGVAATSSSPKPVVPEIPAAATDSEPFGQATTAGPVSAGVPCSTADTPVKSECNCEIKTEPVPMETDSFTSDLAKQS